MEIYPLAKKPGASFRDRITIGRTSNNDVVIVDHSVSRLHGYVRERMAGCLPMRARRTAAGSATRARAAAGGTAVVGSRAAPR